MNAGETIGRFIAPSAEKSDHRQYPRLNGDEIAAKEAEMLKQIKNLLHGEAE